MLDQNPYTVHQNPPLFPDLTVSSTIPLRTKALGPPTLCILRVLCRRRAANPSLPNLPNGPTIIIRLDIVHTIWYS